MLKFLVRLFHRKPSRLESFFDGFQLWSDVQDAFNLMHIKKIQKQQVIVLGWWEKLSASNVHCVYQDWTDYKAQGAWYDATIKLNQMTGFPINRVWTAEELAEPWWQPRLEEQAKVSELID